MYLDDLTQLFGVSGFEKSVREYIQSFCKSYADDIFVDQIGNLIVFKKGTDHPAKKRIMISAHMDEIGFAVTDVTDQGFLKVRYMGGISNKVSLYQKIQFRKGVIGVVLSNGKEEDDKDFSSLYVDIGASSKEEAMSLIDIGEPASYIGPFTPLTGRLIASKAMDDRIGCYILMRVLSEMETPPMHDVFFVFSVQEEVGLRGAKVAVHTCKPDIGVAVDITGSFDTPGAANGFTKLGKGAAIKVMDGSVICDDSLVTFLCTYAASHQIPHQREVLARGGTDAGAIHLFEKGVPSCGISIPTRYAHSPVGIVDMADVGSCIYLLDGMIHSQSLDEKNPA
ncbi:MAG: M20/M25/M40 family metallo-hydrolase [Caldisericia bacterium]|nr:M20/M25/M40 family metallo-hydrolase [Caldisericia bacterium]MDD4614430.1 M20/M25/M40 family metallo-hydrolase [Caldisericia bacterium]